MLMLDR
jgi:hypothetical protein